MAPAHIRTCRRRVLRPRSDTTAPGEEEEEEEEALLPCSMSRTTRVEAAVAAVRVLC